MALTYAYVTIQDLKFTEKQLGSDITITYEDGGTAGSESVHVSDSRLITVTIENGVSTAAQIKTAVEANARANALVTVTVPGTASNAQLTCVGAALSGGAAAVKASKSFFGLYVEALAAGTSGNSIRIDFNEGADDVTVAGNDITVVFTSGATAAHVASLINADAEANLLVKASGSSADTLRVAMNPNLTALAGGAAAVAPSVIVQDLTYASDTASTLHNGATVTYTTGATAGAEVVSVSGTDISVQIENGVSTATQIAAAVNASDAANGAKATASVTVLDYATGDLTAASGTVTVVDYTKASAVKASGTVTVVSYAPLHKQKASKVIQDLTYTAVAFGPGGNSITVEYVDAGAIGDNAVVECDGNTIVVNMDDTAVTGTTANTIKAAVNADPEASLLVLVSGASANVQAVQASTALENGQNAATLTVNGTVLTESIDWTAATDNNTTAASLELAIEAVTNINSSAAANAITVEAAATGTGGNSYTLATSDAANLTISGATLTGGRAATTVTINGTPLVANVDWTAETDNDTTAANLEVAIEAVTGINSSAAAAVITVTAATPGTAGNAYTLATSNSQAVSVGAATLSGGKNALVITVNGTAVTEGSDFNAETNNNTTATNLATAIDGLAGYSAAAVGPVVTITYDTRGTSGNTKTLTTSNAAVASVSGALFTGGTDAFATTVSGTGATAQVTVNALGMAGAVGEGARAYSNSQAGTALTNAFVAFNWSFPSKYFRLINDETAGTDTIAYSLDGGVTTHGTLTFGEELLLGTDAPLHGIHLKYVNAAPNYRISVIG